MIDVLIGHHCRLTEFFHMRKVCRTKPDSSNHAFTTSTCYFHKKIFFFPPTNTFHSPPLQPKYFSHAHSRLLFTAIENPTTTTPSTRCPRNTTLPFILRYGVSEQGACAIRNARLGPCLLSRFFDSVGMACRTMLVDTPFGSIVPLCFEEGYLRYIYITV